MALARALVCNRTLHSLDLSGNRITRAPVVEQFFHTLLRNHTLKELKLENVGCKIDFEGALTELLGLNRSLTTFDLSNGVESSLNRRGMPAFARVLEQNACVMSCQVRMGTGSLGGSGSSSKRRAAADVDEYEVSPLSAQTLKQVLKENSIFMYQRRLPAEPEVQQSASLHHESTLNMSAINLTAFPPSMAHWKGVRQLVLSGNRLAELPDSLAELRRLRALWLNQNQLTRFTPAFGDLHALVYLNLSDNRLGAAAVLELGASVVKGLRSLQHLVLSHNQLRSLPDELVAFRALRVLDLSCNQLEVLPIQLGALRELTELYLCHNQLAALPNSLGDLSNLVQLDVSHNRLEYLPVELGSLKKRLHTIVCEGNPLSTIPLAILQMGTPSIVTYLDELQRGGESFSVVKLMFVGQGNVGKTSLVGLSSVSVGVRLLKLRVLYSCHCCSSHQTYWCPPPHTHTHTLHPSLSLSDSVCDYVCLCVSVSLTLPPILFSLQFFVAQMFPCQCEGKQKAAQYCIVISAVVLVLVALVLRGSVLLRNPTHRQCVFFVDRRRSGELR
jgi:Leucine-rich repeat (LRR) protein